jgi:hypothetical protein
VSQSRPQRTPPPENSAHGALFAVLTGAVAMSLLWALALVAPELVALLASGIVAALGGAVSASRLGRGPKGANLAGLYSLAGVALVAIPLLLSGTGSGISDFQVVLFGLALAALVAMGGQLSGLR